MQYMLMNYVPAATAEGSAAPEYHSDMDAWSAYTKAMVDAGVMRSGNALNPGYSATTVRLRDGLREVQDGPYADSKEELGGYYVIEEPTSMPRCNGPRAVPPPRTGWSRCVR